MDTGDGAVRLENNGPVVGEYDEGGTYQSYACSGWLEPLADLLLTGSPQRTPAAVASTEVVYGALADGDTP